MPKILWLSPYSLHDLSSGASIHCKALLENLAQRGFEVWSCASFIFDVPSGASSFLDLPKLLQSTEQKVFELDDNHIHYVYVRCESTAESDNNLAEQNLFFHVTLEVLNKFKPDFVIGFGTSMSSMTCFAEAKRRGIYTIYPLVNGNHAHYAFPNVDFILTDSKATANLYRQRDHINTIACKEFFDPKLYLVNKKDPQEQYITFINPSFEKGLNIMAALALKCKKEMPELKFLVVNSRSNFAEAVNYLHTKGNTNEHPLNPQMFTNVSMTNSTRDMRIIYAQTKLLLVPSLWWESWGRVASEAILNHIPVLASNSGGLMEATANVGVHLSVPEHCLKDYTSLPTQEEIEPWFNALKQLLNADLTEQFQYAQKQLGIEHTLDNIIKVLTPYIENRPCDHIHYGFSQTL